ncbi:MAG: protein-methionine-sulfoxide reductase heme-binding subunit MsrQ [Luteimonas sp.]
MVLSPGSPAPARRSSTPGGVIAGKALVHLLCLAPLAWLGWRVWQVLGGANVDALGAEPVVAIEHELGIGALRLLLITLAITPLRQISGWPTPVRFRRMLGLYAFVYASLHFAVWLALDLVGDLSQVATEIARRPFITVGFLAWLLLVPLAVTSTKGWMRRLGRSWGRLHKAIYAIAAFAVLHFWWIVKSDWREPALYAGILALLLGWRVWKAFERRRVPGAAVARGVPPRR